MYVPSYLCISPAVPLNPFHNKSIMPVTASDSRNLVRVMKFHIAREGGSRARAAFQLTPPFGRSMLGKDTPSGAQRRV